MFYKIPLKHLIVAISFLLFSNVQAAAIFDCVIEPTQTVEIRSPVIGLLEKVTVRRGDSVIKNQILAQLDSSVETTATDLALYKSKMTAPIESAENKIVYAKRKFLRRQDMHTKDFYSAQEMEEAESEFKLAQSELKMAYENKELAKLEWEHQNSQLKLRTIRSPFDGVVVEQNIYPGEVVEPSGQKQSILTLAQLNPLRIYVILPLSAFGKVKPAMKANVNPESPISGQYVGKVNIIDRVVNAASGTFGVFLEVPNPRFTVPAGVKCKAEFPIDLGSSQALGNPS